MNRCEDCYRYSRCLIVGEFKEIVRRQEEEREEVEQLRLTDDPTTWKERMMSLRRRQRTELGDIARKQGKCFRRMAYLAR